jgi:hypothetical protein
MLVKQAFLWSSEELPEKNVTYLSQRDKERFEYYLLFGRVRHGCLIETE